MDVETETSREWTKDVDTETPSRLSLISVIAAAGLIKLLATTVVELNK